MAGLSSYLPNLLYGLAAALATGAMAWAARCTSEGPRGWRAIRPSGMHWFGLIGCVALVALMGYVYLFIGSTRPDGPHQMRVLFWLIVAFSTGGVLSALAIHWVARDAVRWRGRTIEFGGPSARERRSLDAVAETRIDWLQRVVIRFDDGARLIVDPHAQGAVQLLEAIRKEGEAEPRDLG